MPPARARNCKATPAASRPPQKRPSPSTKVRLKAVPASATNTEAPGLIRLWRRQAPQPTRARSMPSQGGSPPRGTCSRVRRRPAGRSQPKGNSPTDAQASQRAGGIGRGWGAAGLWKQRSSPTSQGACRSLVPAPDAPSQAPSSAQCQRLFPSSTTASSPEPSSAEPSAARPGPAAT